MAAREVDVPLPRLVEELVSSPSDEKEYVSVVLANGLRVLLVHTAKGDRSACALAVRVGYFNDPEHLPGLAHCVEHMVFLGTEKYPGEDSFSRFVSEHGGSDNASTSSERTTFYFDIASAVFEEALDRFASFFTQPLMTSEAVARELEAIHNEFLNDFYDEDLRRWMVLKCLADPRHPFSKFDCGNNSTLVEYPTENGIDIRAEAMEFFRSHYSADLMTLVVASTHPISVLEKWVANSFSGVVKLEEPARVERVPVLPPSSLGVRVDVAAARDINTLSLAFVWPPTRDLYRTKSDDYICHLVGHEADGSVLSVLKALGWADELAAGVEESSSDFCLFVVDIDLTDDGVAHVNDVCDVVFGYLGRLRQCGPQEWLWNEMHTDAAKNFRFLDDSTLLNLVTDLIQNTILYEPEDWVRGDYVYESYQPDQINKLLELLVPERAVIVVHTRAEAEAEAEEDEVACEATDENDEPTSPSTPDGETLSDNCATTEATGKRPSLNHDDSNADSSTATAATSSTATTVTTTSTTGATTTVTATATAAGDMTGDGGSPDPDVRSAYSSKAIEPIYATPYSVRSFEAELVAQWTALARAETEPPPTLHLPHPNPFAPTDFEITTAAEGDSSEVPRLLRVDDATEVWYKKDTVFERPYVSVGLFLRSHLPSTYPVQAELFSSLVEDSLQEIYYYALVSGLSYSVTTSCSGVGVSVYGYSHKIFVLLELVVKRLATIEFDPVRFQVAKEDLERRRRNRDFDEPLKVAHRLRRSLFTFPKFAISADDVPLVTMEDMNSYRDSLVNGELFVSAHFYGNLTEATALEATASVLDELLAARLPLVRGKIPQLRFGKLEGEYIMQRNSKEKKGRHSAIVNYYQAGPEDIHTIVLCDVTQRLVAEKLYHRLRTTEQLGYTVDLYYTRDRSVLGFAVEIQGSKASPVEMDERIEAALRDIVGKQLPAVSEEDYRACIEACLAIYKEKSKSLSEEGDRLWGEILELEYVFDRPAVVVAEIERTTLEQVAQFARTVILGEGRSKLSVQVFGGRFSVDSETGVVTTREDTDEDDAEGSDIAGDYYDDYCGDEEDGGTPKAGTPTAVSPKASGGDDSEASGSGSGNQSDDSEESDLSRIARPQPQRINSMADFRAGLSLHPVQYCAIPHEFIEACLATYGS